MKKGLLGSTALVAATALTAGVASAQQAPTYSLSGHLTVLGYYVDQDVTPAVTTGGTTLIGPGTAVGTATLPQDDSTLFFGVNSSELRFDVEGQTDTGLDYGFKIELNANEDEAGADEVVGNIGGSWGTILFGGEDGPDDIMMLGGFSLLGGVAGYDGEMFRVVTSGLTAAPSTPSVVGDTGDNTKLIYYSPKFAGLQVGVGYTPNAETGRTAGLNTAVTDHIGLGAQYDNSFGGVRVRVAGTYGMADTPTGVEDIASFHVGGVLGFGPFSVGAGYGDSGDSGSPTAASVDRSFWDAAVGFESGPIYLSAGYFVGTAEPTGAPDQEMTVISLAADYTVAQGFGVLAEINLSEEDNGAGGSNDATNVIVGTKWSF